MDEEVRELERRDADTPEEAEEAASGQMDSEEAHRYGEFRELRAMLEQVLDELRGLREDMPRRGELAAEAIESGAVVSELGDGLPDAVELDTDGNVEELVYDIDALDLDLEEVR